MVLSLFSVIMKTYGSVALCIFAFCGLTLVIHSLMQRNRCVARHCKYYYIVIGDESKRKSKTQQRRKSSSPNIRVGAAPSPREPASNNVVVSSQQDPRKDGNDSLFTFCCIAIIKHITTPLFANSLSYNRHINMLIKIYGKGCKYIAYTFHLQFDYSPSYLCQK